MSKNNKFSLATWIFIGLAAGVAVGLLFIQNPDFATQYIRPFGTLFLNLIKFVVVPIVLFSIAAGVVALSDIRKVGSIGGKAIIYYLCTTAFAVLVGLVVSNLFKGGYVLLDTSSLEYEAAPAPSIVNVLVDIFPSNIIAPLANATMLQVIVVALFFGFGIIAAGEKGLPAARAVESLNEVFTIIMAFIIKLSPIGVFCLIVPVVAVNGPMILGSLAIVLLAAYIAYILHAGVVYSFIVKTFGSLNPLKFFKGMLPAMMLAFSSASSVGTLPLNIDCTKKLGAREDIVNFTLPLGATINMDGTAIYQGLCTVFIASCFGMTLTLTQILTIVLTATLASIGTAGVPGAGMIMLAMVLQSVGLPVEGIAIVAGVDRIFDMGRTTLNITGDAACALVVTKLESKKDAKKSASN
ncbi:MAG: dicarboxylate/amino acid:cation symporter [Clostridiales bacterium]|nr:dicarboxylate/amino acid:cation symporter [Clostridiales bacterium]